MIKKVEHSIAGRVPIRLMFLYIVSKFCCIWLSVSWIYSFFYQVRQLPTAGAEKTGSFAYLFPSDAATGIWNFSLLSNISRLESAIWNLKNPVCGAESCIKWRLYLIFDPKSKAAREHGSNDICDVKWHEIVHSIQKELTLFLCAS